MFDIDRFVQAEFKPRTAIVAVPTLKLFFGDEPAQWEVRNLTVSEMVQVKTSRAKLRNQAALLSLANARANTDTRVNALAEIIACSMDVESETTARIEMVVLGSINPKVGYDVVAKLARAHAQVLWTLSDKIGELTDGGAVLEQPPPSGN